MGNKKPRSSASFLFPYCQKPFFCPVIPFSYVYIHIMLIRISWKTFFVQCPHYLTYNMGGNSGYLIRSTLGGLELVLKGWPLGPKPCVEGPGVNGGERLWFLDWDLRDLGPCLTLWSRVRLHCSQSVSTTNAGWLWEWCWIDVGGADLILVCWWWCGGAGNGTRRTGRRQGEKNSSPRFLFFRTSAVHLVALLHCSCTILHLLTQ